MSKQLLREFIESIILEGMYDSASPEAKSAIRDIQSAGYDELANIILKSWVMHDRLGEEVMSMAKMKSDEGLADAFKIADQLVRLVDRTLRPRLEQIGKMSDYFDEEVNSAKSALISAESSKDISLQVQWPIHNAIENAVESILDKSLN
jgi:hypothetical protein